MYRRTGVVFLSQHRIPASHRVLTGSGNYPARFAMENRTSLFCKKRGRVVKFIASLMAEVKNRGSEYSFSNTS
jgi:hypothetical protein